MECKLSFIRRIGILLENQYVKQFRAFFHSGQMLRELNITHITLILKLINPDSVNHYRPISLCNITYETISKVLANRLKLVLPKIVSPLQGAFIKSWEIHDNILVAHEILNSFSKKKYGYMTIKLEMEKTYDRLDWQFVRKCFTDFGFADK